MNMVKCWRSGARNAAALVVGTCTVAGANAQQTPLPFTGLEEVVVTAERRAESVQDVPVAVTAFSAAALDTLQVKSTVDLMTRIPSLVGTQQITGESGAAFFLRGVGQDEQISTFDPSVGIYVDGVYVPRQVSTDLAAFDLERLEVLRGPQGTLYGRNTSGGAVKFIRRKPTESFEGFVEASYGNFDRYSLQGVVNVPLTDSVSTRFGAFTYQQDKGFQYAPRLDERFFNRDSTGAVASIRFRPNDRVDVTASLDWNLNKPKPAMARSLESGTGDDLFTAQTSIPGQKVRTETTSATLNASIRFEAFSLTSITGYRTTTFELFDDVGDSPNPAQPLFVLPTDAKYDSWSQEFQVDAKLLENRLGLIGGVFFQREENEAKIGDIFFVPPAFGGSGITKFWKDPLRNNTDSFAVYTQGDYKLTPTLSLTVGGRWTRDSRDLSIDQYLYTTFTDLSLTGPRVLLWDTGDVQALGTRTDVTETEFTPKVGLDWHPVEDILVYASYTKGFRSGGWNARVTSPTAVTNVDSEVVKAYEVGLKSEWLDRRVRANFVAFRNKFDNFIVTAINATGNFVTVNAAKARMQGIEGELTFKPLPSLEIYGNFGYLDSKYLEIAPNVPIPITNKLKNAPRWTHMVGVNYIAPLDSTLGTLTLSADTTYKSSYFPNLENPPFGKVYGQHLYNARISYASASSGWEVFGGCTNCTDEHHYVSFLNFGIFNSRYPAPPRVWDAGVRFNFGK